jgi:NADP-dependent 3-hydroxy acid dehydrogenase YdfG
MAADGRKSIFITGAASGIGLACAKRFASAGWFVGLSDIDKAGLKAALDAIGPDNGSVHPLDVRDREGWENALGDFGRVTERQGWTSCSTTPASRGSGCWRTCRTPTCDIQIDVNIKGVINGARAGLPLLKARRRRG